MELVLISPEAGPSALGATRPTSDVSTQRFSSEFAVFADYCAAGLGRYHVRKPGWSRAQLAAWIEAVPAPWRSRLVLHSHHELVEEYGLLGRHWSDGEVSGWSALPPTRWGLGPSAGSNHRDAPDRGGDNAVHLGLFTSCSCHALKDLAARNGQFDSVFFGPVFVSPTKPERPALSRTDLAPVSAYLQARTPAERRTKVIALSGITPERVPACRAMGFDGVATISGVYGSTGGMERDLRARWIKSGAALTVNVAAHRAEIARHLMCLTQDGEALDHVEQAAQLCAAGAKLIQLRVKGADLPRWTEIAASVTRICHTHGARCLINDRPDLALAVGADGAHVGQHDGDWREARRLLGPGKLLGGTVNDLAGARRAVEAGCLDYVGVGPFRFTRTKQKLAPVLGVEGVREVIAALDGLPAWVIGGIQAADLPVIAATGAAGVAVSSYLYRGAGIAEQFRELSEAWPLPEPAEPVLSVS